MSSLTIKDVGEFGLIQRISHDFIYRPELVKIPSGDDGAVYEIPPGYDQVISTDTMVDGIHFTNQTMKAFEVGYHLAASNISDMAAMGAEAVGMVISLSLPDDLPVDWVESCYDGIRACARKYRVNIFGGDVTGARGALVLTGTVIGMVPSGTAVPRSGARKGDVVFVTHTIGDSAAGLHVLLHGMEEDYPYLAGRHKMPEPQIELGMILRKAGAHALNDISDGLSRELNEIALASHVEIEIMENQIPLSEEIRRLGRETGISPLSWAYNGGEDYQLVGTISPEDFDKIKGERNITPIGKVIKKPGNGVYIIKDIKKELLRIQGFDHFSQ